MLSARSVYDACKLIKTVKTHEIQNYMYNYKKALRKAANKDITSSIHDFCSILDYLSLS